MEVKEWLGQRRDAFLDNVIWTVGVAALAAVALFVWALIINASTSTLIAIGVGLVVLCLQLVQLVIMLQSERARDLAAREAVPLVSAEAQTLLTVVGEQRNRPFYHPVRLLLQNVDCSRVTTSSPSVILRIAGLNFLPYPVELVRIERGNGTVEVHDLPDLPSSIAFSLRPLDETRIEIKLPLHGQVPDHLRDEAHVECPKPLHWVFRGRWYAQINGEERLVCDVDSPLEWWGVANVSRT